MEHLPTASILKYFCKKCDIEFESSESLIKHLENCTKKKLKCNICEKTFNSFHVKNSHQKTQHENPITECKFCKKGFHPRALKNHIARAHSQFQSKCVICDKKLKCKRDLVKHIKKFHQKALQKCSECDKSFVYLQTHMDEVHRKIKSFKCTQCEKVFTRNWSLKSHIKTVHERVKDVKCNACEKEFSSSGDCLNHYKNVHGIKVKAHKCDICDMAYFTKARLKYHKEKKHTKVKSKCDLCEKTFDHLSFLTTHRKYTHAIEKKFKCSKCDKLCSTPTNLRIQGPTTK